MQAIIPNRPVRVRPYAWGSISVNPDPPRVGEVTCITLPLANPGPGELVVERIEVGIAAFGMGIPWEQLDVIGPYHLPPDANRIIEATAEWTPREGGHRCVRASIHVRGLPHTLIVGRNLDVIRAGEYEGSWRIPFRVGNPEPTRAPIVLRVDGRGDADVLHADVRMGERGVRAGQPIWLEPGEVVGAELHLRAAPGHALDAVRTVEAYIGDRFIDGIQVDVLRPAASLAIEPQIFVPESAAAESVLAG